MIKPAFADHLMAAQQQPAYWSYLATLEFIDSLVAEMDVQGVNAAELARRMGTSRAWVSRVLTGQCNLTVATMTKLALALGMRVTTGLAPADVEPASATSEKPRTPARPPVARRRKSA